jgi:hypothetical protein
VIYLTLGNYPSSHYAKIYAKVAADFCFERNGDRAVMLSMRSDPSSIQVGSSLKTADFQLFSSSNDGLGDLMSKIREGIVSSFQVRSSLYYAEIRKLDATRGTANFDFKQLFLVKESFALLYQMMQLLDMALAQYEELEAMLAYAPPGILFDGWWPLKAPEQLKTGESLSPDPSKEREKDKDIMADPVKNGDDIVTYSINIARMKVLKGKMSLLELYRYIFARQMFFLVTMHRPVDCAEKIKRFMTFSYQAIESKIAEIEDRNARAAAHMQATVWAFASSIKCVRLCRDLIDSMIAADNVSGLESTQSVAAILNAVRASSYRLRASDSDQRESSLMPMDRSNRDTHLAKDKILAFRESFILLGDILQSAIQKFNSLVPIKQMLRKTRLYCIHRSKMFDDDSSVELPESDPSVQYFQLFERSLESRVTLDRDLDSSSFSVVGGLEQVLSAISQRIRSVSHYWAKLYHSKSFEALFSQEDPLCVADKTKKYMFLMTSCRFQSQQIEKGRILEASLHALITLVASEFGILCERRSVALVERYHLAEHLFCSGQYQKCSEVLNGLMYDGNGGNIYLNPWASNWPDLMMAMLLMMGRCSLELKNHSDFRRAVATMATLCVQQKDYFRADMKCSFDKMKNLLIYAPEGIVYNDSFSIPSKGLFNFQLLRAIYAEELTPNDHLSSPKNRFSIEKGAMPAFNKIKGNSMSIQVPIEHFVRRKGMQLVHENPFPVQWLICVCDQGNVPIQLRIKSSITNIPLDCITVYFRRVPPQGFDKIFGTVDLTHSGNGLNDDIQANLPPLSQAAAGVSGENNFVGTEVDDAAQFSCSVEPNVRTIESEQVIEFQMLPVHLGDYVFDRFELRSGSLIFTHRILDDYESFSSQSLEFQNPIVNDEDVQRYFDNFPIVRISPPQHILTFDLHSGEKLPPNQLDFVYLTFNVPAGDFISELSIDVKAISRCRRWSGKFSKPASFTATSSVQYRAEWMMSPVRSFYRSGEERSSSIDETYMNQYMARDYSVFVNNPIEWNCWEVVLDENGLETRSSKEVATHNESLVLRNLVGGKKIIVQIPVTIKTSLLTNISEEFTLQSPFQVQVQGLIRKGACVVPFQATGNSTLLCSNVLKSMILQEVFAGQSRHLVQLQLHNIHHQALSLVGNAFVLDGDIIDVRSEINQHDIVFPESLPLFSGVEEVTKFNTSNMESDIFLSPGEEFHTFVQTAPLNRGEKLNCISSWRVYYRRDESNLTSSLPDTNKSIFWVDVPLVSVVSMALESNPLLSSSKEGRILSVVTTQAPCSCILGEIVVLRARVGLRGSTFRYLVDSVEALSLHEEFMGSCLDLSEFRSSFQFEIPDPRSANANVEVVRCELVECPAWIPLGINVVKSPSSTLDYELQIAIIPGLTGLHDLPPLMVYSSREFFSNTLLLVPHNASHLSHALIQPMRTTSSICENFVSTTSALMASFEELKA